jgi:hypothetical protein
LAPVGDVGDAVQVGDVGDAVQVGDVGDVGDAVHFQVARVRAWW